MSAFCLVALRDPQPTDVLFDWDRACALLAAEQPWFEAGTAHAEHTLFYGHLCGQLVRRTDGRSLGKFWREEVAAPSALDSHIGTEDREQLRVVDLVGEIPNQKGTCIGWRSRTHRVWGRATVTAWAASGDRWLG